MTLAGLSWLLPFGKGRKTASAPALIASALLGMLLVMALGTHAAAASSGSLPFDPSAWFSVALVATLVIITVAAMVYALSTVIVSENAKNWSRAQIYEAVLSLVMLALFIALSYLFFLNPQGAFNAVGLLPSSCTAQDINTLFNLSACDIGSFTNTAYGYYATFVYSGFILGLAPGVSVDVYLPGQPDAVGIGTSLDSVIPNGIAGIISVAVAALLTALVLNQVQVILLSSAMLFLSLFVTLGLVARTFGFTRTFGGAMIAIGLGLGLVYPLLVSITYGFVNTQVVGASVAGNISAAIQLIVWAVTGIASSGTLPFLVHLGYVAMGLTFVPFINFIILDAFIVDFSKAIGERIDFMSMMVNFI